MMAKLTLGRLIAFAEEHGYEQPPALRREFVIVCILLWLMTELVQREGEQ